MKLEQKGQFLEELAEREKREREERAPHSLYDHRSSSGRLVLGQDLKSEYLSRTMCGHQNQEFLSEI